MRQQRMSSRYSRLFEDAQGEKGVFLNFNLISDSTKRKVLNGIKNAGIKLYKTSAKGLAKVSSMTDTTTPELIGDTAIIIGILEALGANPESLGVVGLYALGKYLPKTKIYKNLALWAQTDAEYGEDFMNKKIDKYSTEDGTGLDAINKYRLDRDAKRNRIEQARANSVKESRMLRLKRRNAMR